MPRKILRPFVSSLLVGAICTVPWINSPATPQSVVLVGYGSSLESVPGAVHTLGTVRSYAAATFSIAGNVSGLFPGKSFPLVLTLGNPNKLAITVTTITTTVENATSTCVATNVSVTEFSGHFAVGAGKTGKVKVSVTLKASAPKNCEGRSFPFHYTGTAKEA